MSILNGTADTPGAGNSATGWLASLATLVAGLGGIGTQEWPQAATHIEHITGALLLVIAFLGAAKAVKTSQVAKHAATIEVARINAAKPEGTQVTAATANIAPASPAGG